MKIDFWSNFEILYLREYFIEFHKTASPDILGIEDPQNVAKNVGNIFYRNYWQQLRNKNFGISKYAYSQNLELLPIFPIESVADIFGNMMGTLYPQNVRRRDFMKFHKIFVKIQNFKIQSKMGFHVLWWNFIQNPYWGTKINL